MPSSFARFLTTFLLPFTLTSGLGAEEINEAYSLTPAMINRIERERYLPSRPDATRQNRNGWKKAWIASWAAFAAVNVVDVHSSRGKTELNPFLQSSTGQFSVGRATVIKAAAGGAFFAFQRWIIRRHPDSNQYKTFTIANSGASAALGAVAAHNYQVDKR